jgi:hypothetical protein
MSYNGISKAKELKYISIYLYICYIYDSKFRNACERFSNNNNPDLTDQEVITLNSPIYFSKPISIFVCGL